MNDCYVEKLVKQKTPFSTVLKRVGLGILTLLGLFYILLYPLAFPVIVVLIAIDVILFKRMNLEFEYIYFNGELDIDKIMAQESRKRVFSTTIKDVEVIAPTGSVELHPYQRLKTYDFSSGRSGAKTYELVTVEKGRKVRIVFEPDEEILNHMRLYIPRKVFL